MGKQIRNIQHKLTAAAVVMSDYATLGMDFLSSKLTHCRSTRYIDD